MDRGLTLAFLVGVVFPPILLHWAALIYAHAWSRLDRKPFMTWRQARDERLYYLTSIGCVLAEVILGLWGIRFINRFVDHVILDCGGYMLTPTGVSNIPTPGLVMLNFGWIILFDALVQRGWRPGYLTVTITWLPLAIIYWLLEGAVVYHLIIYYYPYNC